MITKMTVNASTDCTTTPVTTITITIDADIG